MLWLLFAVLLFTGYYYLESSGITGFAIFTDQAILHVDVEKFHTGRNATECYSLLEGTVTNTGNIPAYNVSVICDVHSKSQKLLGAGSVFIEEINVGTIHFRNQFDTVCADSISNTYSCDVR